MTTGPSTSTTSFLLASEPNVRFTPIITSGDPLPGGGVFGGIPDGLGAYDNGDGTITVLVNHEWLATEGIAHGPITAGSYIDRLVIDKATLGVVSSGNLATTLKLWDDTHDQYLSGVTTAFNRFCSGDLAHTSAFYNPATGLGANVQIYMTGEEVSTEGRATATLVTGSEAGTLYELPFLGNLAFENLVANPYAQDKTIVAMDDDGLNGQVYIYVGQKQATGTDIEKAGLSGGDFYGIKVAGFTDEADGTPVSGTFTLDEIGTGGDVSNMTGAQIDSESEAEGVTSFKRPEDFSWDPQHPNVAYFTTTNSFTGHSRIYQLTFSDITNPAAGGTIQMIVDSADYGAHMFDNLTVADGRIIVQEDPGNQAYVARVWQYDIASGSFSQVATFDPAKFTPGSVGFITQDEESSGVIDVTSLLGNGHGHAYLLDAQVHAPTGNPATVEQGQLSVMYVDDPKLIGGNGSDALFGSASNETLKGYNGDDTAQAGSGDDTVYGGNGDDLLAGGAGNDQLFGENGNDTLIGGGGNDRLSGGKGNDWFVFDNSTASGADQILDFSKSDHILTTVQLADPNNDGRVEFAGPIDLGGTGSVAINGVASGTLAYEGTVSIGGTTYYSYDLASGASPSGAAAIEAHAMHAGHLDLFHF